MRLRRRDGTVQLGAGSAELSSVVYSCSFRKGGTEKRKVLNIMYISGIVTAWLYYLLVIDCLLLLTSDHYQKSVSKLVEDSRRIAAAKAAYNTLA